MKVCFYMRDFLATALCKATRTALRITNRGGTALPGRLAMKVSPEILKSLGKDVEVLLVTGTNGKTTSARMLEQAFADTGKSYFSNKSGSNLIQGITSDFAVNTTFFGKSNKKYAVIECDEAASKEVIRLVKPKVILVTNVFRDQLDRFGEITHTLENIYTGLSNAPDATICLNADCSLTSSLAKRLPNKICFYGVDVPLYEKPAEEVSDALHCIECKNEYKYTYKTYGHLGGFYCENCGYKRQSCDVSVCSVLEQTPDYSRVVMNCNGEKSEVKINLPAGYNIYNAAGSVAALTAMGFSFGEAKSAIENFECGFGRMEKFDLGGRDMRMILIKNPAGCNQVLNYISSFNDKFVFALCINDKIADGTDISWLYDVDFEKLESFGDKLAGIYISGSRCYDMALRLKYTGINQDKIKILPDFDELIGELAIQSYPTVVVPTYTAMLEFRSKLLRKLGGKEFWR